MNAQSLIEYLPAIWEPLNINMSMAYPMTYRKTRAGKATQKIIAGDVQIKILWCGWKICFPNFEKS